MAGATDNFARTVKGVTNAVEDPSPATVHPTAVIEPGASLGAGTRVWHHAHVRAGASVGVHCVLGKNVFVDAGVEIGNGVKVQNNVSVYAGVTLEDEVFVGPSAVFTNDRVPRAATGHWNLTPTIVRVGASIGANATVVAGVEIGPWALVAAGAVVTRSVEHNEVVAGNPARRVGWVCRCGTTRRPANSGDPVVCPQCDTLLDQDVNGGQRAAPGATARQRRSVERRPNTS